jgi:hypothetical protein
MNKLLCVVFVVAGVVVGCGPTETTYQGRTIDQWLQMLKANTNSTEDPLKIARTVHDNESRVVTVEVPLAYDLLKEHDFLIEGNGPLSGKLSFVVNGQIRSSFCERATNGYCLMSVSENDFAFHIGTNQLRVEFVIFGPWGKNHHYLYATGPITEFVSSNICHINPYIGSTYFKGVILYADLSASNVAYTIDLQTPAGDHIRTFYGNTTNSIVNERWDLTDDHGNIYTNPSVNAVYYVKLPNSLSEIRTQVYQLEHH